MKKIIALAVATAISAPAMADLTIGGSARYQIDNGAGVDTSASTNRVLVSVSGSTTAESGLFVSAGATLQIAADDAANNATTDGDNNIVVGNPMANVALGYTETAGVYSNGADQFKVGPAAQSRVLGRHSDTVVLNVTAVEGLTAQVAGYLTDDSTRVVLGYDFGGVSVAVGMDQASDAAKAAGSEDALQLKVATSVAGAGVTLSYADQDDTDSQFVNLGVTYMGVGVNYQTSEVGAADSVDSLYGSYSLANAGGLEGLTVTVGAGSSDNVDSNYGVRLDYAF